MVPKRLKTNFGPDRQFLTPPPYRAEVPKANLLYENFCFGGQTWFTRSVRQIFFFHIVNWPSELRHGRGGSKIVGWVRKFFGAFLVPQSPIGLISAEIGAPCRIPGHAK